MTRARPIERRCSYALHGPMAAATVRCSWRFAHYSTASTELRSFIRSSAAFVTLPVRFIPFSFALACGPLSSDQFQRRFACIRCRDNTTEVSHRQACSDICHIGLKFEGDDK